ncbi:PREDICTED: uncharacterized protein LOC101313570 [Fragaria vesca subsp. vesca]
MGLYGRKSVLHPLWSGTASRRKGVSGHSHYTYLLYTRKMRYCALLTGQWRTELGVQDINRAFGLRFKVSWHCYILKLKRCSLGRYKFRVEREMKLKALVSGGEREIDGGWKDGCFLPIVIKGSGIEGEAAMSEPCVVVQNGVYATVLRDGDADIWIDGEWKPGDSFLLSHVVTVVDGRVL